MSNNSTQLSFWNPAEEESTSSPQGSLDHAKTSHMQDGKQEFMQTVQDYSLKFSASPMRSMPLAELDPSSCWRTCQQSLLETEEIGEELYMESWPKDTLILNRKLYQQSKWEHYTKETDGGASVFQMFPTPMARDWKDSGKIEKLKNVGKQESLMNRVAQAETKLVQGSLNSRWVSWLMGFPETWCNVDPIGGPKNPTSQESQQESQNESQN